MKDCVNSETTDSTNYNEIHVNATLLDIFAGFALSGLLSNASIMLTINSNTDQDKSQRPTEIDTSTKDFEAIVDTAYNCAELMLFKKNYIINNYI
jgi:hypothetical protein